MPTIGRSPRRKVSGVTAWGLIRIQEGFGSVEAVILRRDLVQWPQKECPEDARELDGRAQKTEVQTRSPCRGGGRLAQDVRPGWRRTSGRVPKGRHRAVNSSRGRCSRSAVRFNRRNDVSTARASLKPAPENAARNSPPAASPIEPRRASRIGNKYPARRSTHDFST